MHLPRGFKIGHYTNRRDITGCTVVLCPPGTCGGCDIRGNSPASRETPLLAADRTMAEIHAVVLTGGSAFGLAAADGVMRFLDERKIGYETPWARIPIVAAAAIFDLNIGSPDIRPNRDAGYRACRNATHRPTLQGNIGAGVGASVGKWAGKEYRMKGGLGMSSVGWEQVIVSAIAVVNSVGDVLDSDGTVLAGARDGAGRFLACENPVRFRSRTKAIPKSNTTLVALLTNAKLGKMDVNRFAQRGHDGMARAIVPLHTSYDGDLVFGLASGQVAVPFDIVAELGAQATAEAIRNAIRNAETLDGVEGLAG